MSDVVLVQPRVGDMDDVRSSPALPLALLHAATLISKDYSVKVIDQRLDRKWAAHLTKELDDHPLCVGITSITGLQIKHALEASKIVKETSGAPVVWGGIHPSLMPEQTLQDKNVDIVVKGEGEITFHKLVKAIDNEASLDGIAGVWYCKENGHIKSNPDREPIDLNEMPDIPYHLVDVSKYMPIYLGKKSIYIQTSRGCAHNCTYCYNVTYNKRCWRALSSEKTLERMRRVAEDFGAENIYLVDDNFFVDMKRAEKIARGLIEEDLDVDWQIQGVEINTIDNMGDEILHLLEKSGCIRMTFGAESGSPRILRMLRKPHTLEQTIRVNKRLSDLNMISYYSFITGFPFETDDDLRQTIRLFLKIIDDNPNARASPIYIFNPYPGTEMFDLAIKEGYVPPETLEGWMDHTWDNANMPYPGHRKKMLESLYFTSLFLDRKFEDFSESQLIKLLARLYRPMARYRTKNLFFRFMIEKKLKETFFRGTFT